MKIALVHDDLIQFGGAEKILLALRQIWPEAPIFTSVVSPAWREICAKQKIKVVTSFMQNFPKVTDWYR
ncbi:glycosyltransferase family 4 protein, partial [candidate division WWE3 bacterium]|nr:glycosyltransferase family 4 protein [candidate division WWE3 bacterium]